MSISPHDKDHPSARQRTGVGGTCAHLTWPQGVRRLQRVRRGHNNSFGDGGSTKNSYRRQAPGRSHQPHRRLRGDSIPQVLIIVARNPMLTRQTSFAGSAHLTVLPEIAQVFDLEEDDRARHQQKRPARVSRSRRACAACRRATRAGMQNLDCPFLVHRNVFGACPFFNHRSRIRPDATAVTTERRKFPRQIK